MSSLDSDLKMTKRQKLGKKKGKRALKQLGKLRDKFGDLFRMSGFKRAFLNTLLPLSWAM